MEMYEMMVHRRPVDELSQSSISTSSSGERPTKEMHA
jgi:hypothetical protein